MFESHRLRHHGLHLRHLRQHPLHQRVVLPGLSGSRSATSPRSRTGIAGATANVRINHWRDSTRAAHARPRRVGRARHQAQACRVRQGGEGAAARLVQETISWMTNRAGLGTASNTDGRRKSVWIKTTVIRQYGASAGGPATCFESRTHRKVWGSTPRRSAISLVLPDVRTRCVGVQSLATFRVSPSLVTERVCKTCAFGHAEFDSRVTHHFHASVAQRQSRSLPTNRHRIVTDRTLQYAQIAQR